MEVLKVVLDDFLDSLPPKYAVVAKMRMEGYEVDEIARQTNRSKRTTERVLNMLRKSLLTQLDIDGVE